jgi:predicted Zn-dependent peptidase
MAFALAEIKAADVAEERGMLERERSTQRADRVAGLLPDFVASELFPKGHPYAPREERGCIVRCELRHVQWLIQRSHRPDNARLVLVGDFDADSALRSVERLFASIRNPPGERLAELAPTPPLPPKHIVVAAPVPRPRLLLYWNVPAALRSQKAALAVLELGLERALEDDLVRRDTLAHDVSVGMQELELGWVLQVSVALLPGIDPKLVERRALAQVARVRRSGEGFDAARDAVATGLRQLWDDPGRRSFLLMDEASGFDLEAALSALARLRSADMRSLAEQVLQLKPALAAHVHRALDAPVRGQVYRGGE